MNSLPLFFKAKANYLILLLTILLPIIGISQTCNNNILTNPDFEAQHISGWEGAGMYAETGSDRYIAVCTNGTIARQTHAAIAGEEYTLTVGVRKSFDDTQGLFRMKFLSSSWQPLHNEFGAINSSSFQTASINFIAPAGTAYVEIALLKESGSGCVDADNWCLSTSGSGEQLPDLNLARLTNLTNAADPGTVVQFNFDLINSGTATASGDYTIGAYLSDDSNFGNADDVKVGEVNTGNTSVGTTSDVLGAISIPNNMPSGSYFLILKADDGEVIAESDETNNFLSGNIFVNDIGGGDSPTVILSTSNTTVTEAFTVNVAFSEDVTGFTLAEIQVTNGTKSNATQQSVSNYSFTVIPISAGDVTIVVPADVAFNSNGDGNLISNTLVVNYVTDPPTGDADLELVSSINSIDPDNYSNFSIPFTLANNGETATTTTEVKILTPSGMTLQGGNEGSASQGSLNQSGKDVIWTVGTLAPNNNATVSLNYFNLSETHKSVYAEVIAQSPNDSDSSPNNGTPPIPNEDDEAVVEVNADGEECQITASLSNIICDDNNTPNDPDDDTYSYQLLVTNGGQSGTWERFQSNIQVSSGTYGTPVTIGAGLIIAAPFNPNSFLIRDAVDATCFSSYSIFPPEPCSNGGDEADLELTSFRAPDKFLFNHGRSTITVVGITNIGDVATPASTMSVYISKDDQFDPNVDVLFSEYILSALNPGDAEVKAPQTTNFLEEGLYGVTRDHPNNYWIAVVNKDQTIAESDFSNNIMVKPFTAVVPDYDLYVFADIPPPSQMEAGHPPYRVQFQSGSLGTAHYSNTIYDRGGHTVSIVDIATSPDLSVAPIATLFTNYFSGTPHLPVLELVIPANIPDGNYYIRWYLDTNFAEKTKDNNLLTFPVTIGDPPVGDECAFITRYSPVDFNPLSPLRKKMSLQETSSGYTIQYESFWQSFKGMYELDLEGNVIAASENPSPAAAVSLEVDADKKLFMIFNNTGTRVEIDINYPNPIAVLPNSSAFKTSTGYAFGVGIVGTNSFLNRVIQTDNFGQNVMITELPSADFYNHYGSFGRVTEGSDGSIYTWWLARANYLLHGIPANGDPSWHFKVAADPYTDWIDTKVSHDGNFVYVMTTENEQSILTKLDANTGAALSFNNLTNPNNTGNYRRSKAYGIEPTTDGGLLVCNSFTEVPHTEPFFLGFIYGKLNTSGDIVWFSEVIDATYSVRPVMETTDGGAIFAGKDENGTNSLNDVETIIIKTTSDGSLTPLCSPVVDLELNASVSNNTPAQWSFFSTTFMVTNNGTADATGVSVTIPTPDGIVIKGGDEYTASQGTFSTISKEWNLGNLAAGDNATIELNYFSKTNSPTTIFGQVTALNETDIDSTPNNNTSSTPSEDDEAAVTINASGVAARQGILEESNIKQIRDYKILNTYPTISNNEITIAINSKKEAQLLMKVYNIKGQEVQQQQINITTGANEININISELNSGMHHVMLLSEKGRPLTTRFIKQRL